MLNQEKNLPDHRLTDMNHLHLANQKDRQPRPTIPGVCLSTGKRWHNSILQSRPVHVRVLRVEYRQQT